MIADCCSVAGQLESPLWADWIAQLTIECQSGEAESDWQNYAIYRLHPFGLRHINGHEISRADIDNAEDQYGVLDALVSLLTPPNRVQRQMDRIAQLDFHPDGSLPLHRETDPHLLQKRAVRNCIQPFKVLMRLLQMAKFFS